jgi:hypothetical protein
LVLQPEHSGVILVTGNLYRGLREIIRDLLKLSKTKLGFGAHVLKSGGLASRR